MTNVIMFFNDFSQATRVFISGIVTVRIVGHLPSAVAVCCIGHTRVLRSDCSRNEIRIYKTQVSVTQRTRDWALRAKSRSNIMVFIKSVLNDQMFTPYYIFVFLTETYSMNIAKNITFI